VTQATARGGWEIAWAARVLLRELGAKPAQTQRAGARPRNAMNQPQNLSAAERGASGAFAALLSVIALRRTHPLVRTLSAVVGLGLLVRAVTGYCGIKAAVGGERSETAAVRTSAVDESIEASFPASDPPASRLADEPPSNADDKWEAVRAAGKLPI
jgi:hypothetical protein